MNTAYSFQKLISDAMGGSWSVTWGLNGKLYAIALSLNGVPYYTSYYSYEIIDDKEYEDAIRCYKQLEYLIKSKAVNISFLKSINCLHHEIRKYARKNNI